MADDIDLIEDLNELCGREVDLANADGMLLAGDLQTIAVWMLRNGWTIKGIQSFLSESSEVIESKV